MTGEDRTTPRPWGTRPSMSRDPMQAFDVGITTPDKPRAGYLGLVGEVFTERHEGKPDKSRAAADAALIVTAVNDYDRLRAIEEAARALISGHVDPSALTRLRAALERTPHE